MNMRLERGEYSTKRNIESELQFDSRAFPRLEIKNYSVFVKLGCEKEERKFRQEIRLDILIQFIEPVPAETTDRLEETICYAQICEKVSNHLRDKEYHLIEKIAAESFSLVKELVADSARVRLSVHKVNPPVERLLGGVKYSVGDRFL